MKTREEKEWKKSCQFCKHFYSFADQLEDDLEPHDIGRCIHVDNIDFGSFVNDETTCDFWEK